MQLNLKVKKKFKQKLKTLATKEDSLLTEVVEKAVDLYEQKIKRQLRYRKRKACQAKPIFLVAHPQTDFKCDNCYRWFEETTAYTLASNWKELDRPKPYTYCRRCVGRIMG